MRNCLYGALLAAGLPCATASYDATVPASFSYDHKAAALEDASFDSLSRIAASYEVDSHVEVIFLSNSGGDTTLFDYEYLDDLQRQLESLSTVSAFASPLQNVHEKIVYHSSLAPTIQKSIDALYREAAETGVMDTVKMNKVLGSFHSRASTGTTLFVLFFRANNEGADQQGGDADADAGGVDDDGARGGTNGTGSAKYHYDSARSVCKRQTFLSQEESFGWIDLSADSQEIQPQHSALPVIATALAELRRFEKDGGHYRNMLASLIHRSGESFNPFPLRTGNTATTTATGRRDKGSSAVDGDVALPPKEVKVLVVTLCAEDERKGHSLCEDDIQAKVVIQELSRIHGIHGGGGGGHEGSVNIRTEYVKFGLNDDLEFAHAYFSSIHHSSTSTASIIDSAELLFWLSSSVKVRNLIQANAARADTDTLLVPIFVIKASPAVGTFLDNIDQRTLVSSFSEPAGGWGVSSMDADARQDAAYMNTDSLIWPENAIISLRSKDQIGASDDMDAVVLQAIPALQCGGSVLPSGTATDIVRSELHAAMKEAIWGMSPTHTHYSGSSAHVIQDYLWHTPVAMQHDLEMQVGLNAMDSFIDRRAVPRMRFIYQAEKILSMFQNLCNKAGSVHPPINSTILFELEINYGTLKTAAQTAGFGKKASSSNDNHVVVKVKSQPGLLSDFLRYMDEAAKEFSHLSYASALQSLNNAQSRLKKLQVRMEHILNTRSGTLSCKSAREISDEEKATALLQGQTLGDTGGGMGVGARGGSGLSAFAWLFSKLMQVVLIAVFVLGGKKLGEKLKRATRTKRYL